MNGRLMHKNIVVTIIGNDESKPFSRVEPFDSTRLSGKVVKATTKLGLLLANYSLHGRCQAQGLGSYGRKHG